MTRGFLRLTFSSAVFCLALGAQAASAQNFFSSLFGGQPPEGRSAYQRDTGSRSGLFGWGGQAAAPTEGTLDPNDPRLHREIIKRRTAVRPHEGGGSTGKQKALEASVDAPVGSLALFSKDKTLRAGDVVVTNRGFLVYQGGDHKDASAFVAVSGSGAGKTDRSSLVALESASRMGTPNVTFTNNKVQRDFIGPRLPEQMEARVEASR